MGHRSKINVDKSKNSHCTRDKRFHVLFSDIKLQLLQELALDSIKIIPPRQCHVLKTRSLWLPEHCVMSTGSKLVVEFSKKLEYSFTTMHVNRLHSPLLLYPIPQEERRATMQSQPSQVKRCHLDISLPAFALRDAGGEMRERERERRQSIIIVLTQERGSTGMKLCVVEYNNVFR
jgi:hypothetical protein